VAVVANPVDWSALYLALYSWASGASGWTTRWADQDEARPDYPYILLDVVSMVKEGGQDILSRSTDLTRARDITVVPTVESGALYRVTINGTAFEYVSPALATVGEIVTALVAAINAGSEPVTAAYAFTPSTLAFQFNVAGAGFDQGQLGDTATTFTVVGDDEALNPGTPQVFNVETTDNLSWENNDEGAEVATTVHGSRVVTLNVQGFVRNTRTDNAAIDPSRNAYNMLTRLQSSLNLPSVMTTLASAGMALVQEHDVVDLSEKVEDSILSRASLDVRLRIVSELVEYSGFIETVAGSSVFSGSRDSPIYDSLSA